MPEVQDRAREGEVTATFLDLFGAPGGMSLGFKMSGMRPVGAVDMFKAGIETYKSNFPEVPDENVLCEDLSRGDIIERITGSTSLGQGDVDVVVGGPPCQGFSTIGRTKIASLVRNGQRHGRNTSARFIDDERNNLYKSFVKLVDYFKPSIVVMENVPGMMSYMDGAVVRQIREDFEGIRYNDIRPDILNAADFGVPQTRRRIFFTATKDGSGFAWPAKTHFRSGENPPGSPKHVTVTDALGDLPALARPKKRAKATDSVRKYRKDPSCPYQIWARGDMKALSNNITRWHRKKDIEVFKNMAPGSKWSQLSLADRTKIGYSNDSFDDKWKRLPVDRPSWTVTSHLSRDGYMYIHPTQSRTISVREAARLQSFPDWFKFKGSRGAQFRQIGNAVPPLLALALAKCVVKMLRK